MSLTNKQAIALRKYVSGNMNDEEKQALAQEMAEHPELHEELEREFLLQQKTMELPALNPETDNEYYARNKQILDAYLAGKEQAAPPQKGVLRILNSRNIRWMAAALVVGMLLTVVLIWRNGKSAKPEPHLANNHSGNPLKDSGNSRVETAIRPLPQNDISLPAMADGLYARLETDGKILFSLQHPTTLFADNRPQEALEAFNQFTLTRSSEGDDESKTRTFLHFYKGLCHYELKNYVAARENLQKANQTRNTAPAIANDIRWYLALAYLQNRQLEPALELLNGIANEGKNNPYAAKARKAIGQLKP